MQAEEINKVRSDHDRISRAIGRAIEADPSLVVYENWVAHLCSQDSVISFDCTGDSVHVNMEVYTMATGGSHEYPEAAIPLDTLNKYL